MLFRSDNSESYKEIKRFCEFEDGIAFSDSGDRKVKFFCPSEKNVQTFISPGRKEHVMEWMKRALLRKYIASLPRRRLYSHWMLLQVALH